MKIAYLGHKYNGFEAHVGNSTPLPTIEDVLWQALVKTKLIFKNEDEPINWEGCEYSKCGRTDKGVSAFGQVIGIRVRSNRPKDHNLAQESGVIVHDGHNEEAFETHKLQDFDDIHDELPYPHLLNRVLPPDIRVLAWCPNPPQGFSARFSCRQRQYRYFFTQPAYSPAPQEDGRRDGSAGWLDIDAMKLAAKKYEGLHDFRNFCKMDPTRQVSNFERRIGRAELVPHPNKSLGLPFAESSQEASTSPALSSPCVYSFDVSGSAFLWHQVRHLVAALFLVGQGFEKPELIDELLDVRRNPGRPIYDMANDRPLVLWNCLFPALDKKSIPDSLHWVYPGDQKPVRERYAMTPSFGEGRYGPFSLTETMWENWHSKKIDEVLAGALLNITQTLPAPQLLQANGVSHPASPRETARLFNGSGKLQSKGAYVPVMQRERIQSPEVLNARWREQHKEKAAKTTGAHSVHRSFEDANE